jgi:hypothetical protein
LSIVRLGISLLLTVLLGLAGLAGAAPAAAEIEGYASYDASSTCHPKPRAGTEYLGHWVARHYGGGYVGFGRPCSKKDGPTSEHQTGRAFDWSLDASSKRDRRTARELLQRIFAADRRGHEDALARRMGVMYLIWDDQMYPAWNQFRPEPYLSSSCRTKKKCSRTLRHRDHVHVSLSRQGARGATSWYAGRL